MPENKKQMKDMIITAGIILVIAFALYNIRSIAAFIGVLFSFLTPFLIGGCIAFVLNILLLQLEDKLLYRIKKKGQRRVLGIILSILIVFLVISLVISLVVPQLTETISSLVVNIPDGIRNLQVWLGHVADDNTQIEVYMNQFSENIENYINQLLNVAQSWLKNFSGGVYLAVSGTISGIVNVFAGFVFAIYLLSQKEVLGRQCIKIANAFLPEAVNKKIFTVLKLTNTTFQKFITGQCLEAVILGMLFLVAMTIFRLPYAMVISVLIMFTALIPVFGAFIGCGVGVFLILIENPVKALLFLVLFLVLQQIEGNLIYPHVVGNSVGLPSIWVFTAVMLGGKMMGVAGMLIFIPCCSVFYTLLKDTVNKRLAGNLEPEREKDIEKKA